MWKIILTMFLSVILGIVLWNVLIPLIGAAAKKRKAGDCVLSKLQSWKCEGGVRGDYTDVQKQFILTGIETDIAKQCVVPDAAKAVAASVLAELENKYSFDELLEELAKIQLSNSLTSTTVKISPVATIILDAISKNSKCAAKK